MSEKASTSLSSSSLVVLAALVAGAAAGAAAVALNPAKRPRSKQAFVGKSYQLFYFDFAGKGEPIRLALTYAGISFEDKRVKSEEWRKEVSGGGLVTSRLSVE